MNMWVFRVGGKGGEPVGQCPIIREGFINPGQLRDSIKTTNLLNYNVSQKIDGYGYISREEFLENELIKYGRLRQGWGFPNLDITLSEKVWIENWIKGCWKYWMTKVDCDSAIGRLRILKHMENMNINDIIFIPNIPINKFTVVKVTKRYTFEDRTLYPDTWLKDFAHVVGVDSIISYSYDVSPLKKGFFSAPYRHAIDPIMEEYESYKFFSEFVDKYYIPMCKKMRPQDEQIYQD